MCKGKVCVCDLCKCGGHCCNQQLIQKLPKALQLLNISETERKENLEKKDGNCQVVRIPSESNLYNRTTYRETFKSKPNIFGVDKSRTLRSTLKCGTGDLESESVSHKEYCPWAQEDAKLCRSRLTGGPPASEDALTLENNEKQQVLESLQDYYCPPRCFGTDKETGRKNCLTPFKKHFQLGPPKKKISEWKRPFEPFSKTTSYMLDYKQQRTEPRVPTPKRTYKQNLTPMSTDTEHKSEFTCPPPKSRTKPIPQKERSSFDVKEKEPMLNQTTSHLDYQPFEGIERPVKKKVDFRPPDCKMESETTTAASYPRWKCIPTKKKVHPELIPTPEYSQHMVTTYQEDYDGLKQALCPAKLIDKYGRNILEPKYCFEGSGQKHDYFHRSKC